MSDCDYIWADECAAFTHDGPLAISLAHHSGARLIAIVPGEPIRETVYRYVRDTHPFLNADNHLVGFEDDCIAVCHPSGQCWFTQRYCIISTLVIQDLIDQYRVHEVEYAAKATSYRDTVRGRKSAKYARSISSDYARRQRVMRCHLENLLAENFWSVSVD